MGFMGAGERELINLREKAKYLEEQIQEMHGIIRQLTSYSRIEGQPVYIHPLDLEEMWSSSDVKAFLVFPQGRLESGRIKFLGVEYQQSVNIPPRTKNIH